MGWVGSFKFMGRALMIDDRCFDQTVIVFARRIGFPMGEDIGISRQARGR